MLVEWWQRRDIHLVVMIGFINNLYCVVYKYQLQLILHHTALHTHIQSTHCPTYNPHTVSPLQRLLRDSSRNIAWLVCGERIKSIFHLRRKMQNRQTVTCSLKVRLISRIPIFFIVHIGYLRRWSAVVARLKFWVIHCKVVFDPMEFYGGAK